MTKSELTMMPERAIQAFVRVLRTTPSEVNCVVKKKPNGVHITIEVTKEQMEEIMAIKKGY